jgi:hypothetical protein
MLTERGSMVDVASYAPTRIFIRGLLRALIGWFCLGWGIAVFVAVFFVMEEIEGKVGLSFPAVLLLLFGLNFPSGIGRMISAFAKNCYLRAGPEGIEARIPEYKLFGRFHILEYFIGWPEVESIVDFTRSLNLIKATHQLRIHRRDGTVLGLDSYLFSENILTIQQRLLAIQARRNEFE